MQFPVRDSVYKNDIFAIFIEQHAGDTTFKKIIESTDVLRVKVNKKDKKWLISLKCYSYIAYKEIVYLKEKLSLYMNNFIKIEISPFFVNEIQVDTFFKDYEELISKIISANMPVTSSWSNKISWDIQENIITIDLPTPILKEYFAEKQYDLFLQNFLLENFNLKCFIKYTCKDCLDINEEKSILPDAGQPVKLYVPPNPQLAAVKQVKRTESKSDIILGKKIAKDPIAIKNIVEEERAVVIAGIINNLQVRNLKSGRNLITFDLFDSTSGINVKIFEDDRNKGFSDKIQEKQYVLVSGSVQQDLYSQDLTLLAQNICLHEPEKRMDHEEIKRVELHLHTKMSPLDGLTEVKAAIQTAADWGHKAIAITDHGVVQAFPEAYDAGKKYGIKIIYGVEGYLINSPENFSKQKSYHVIILVKNQVGLENLYRLISKSHLEYFFRKPRIPKPILDEYREGLIVGSACEAGELIQAILQNKTEDEIEQIASYYDYLEIQPLGNNEFMIRKNICSSKEDLININKKIIALGAKLNKPVVATGDVHFLNPEDEIYRRILMAGKGFTDDAETPLYLRTTEEMLREFDYLDQESALEVVVKNPNLIEEQIEDVLPIPTELYPPEIEGAEEQITEMSWAKAKSIYGELLPDIVKKRLEKELNSIVSNGFSVLYLIAQKLVKKSNDDGYLVGSRGSVGSSFVATMTGITEVNPLPPHYLCPNCKHSEFIVDGSYNSGADMPDKNCSCGAKYLKDGHDIPFETFLGFKGDKVPDIDLNFSGDYQPRAFKFIEDLFGKDYVFRAGTIATVAERTAYGFVKNYFDEKNYRARKAEINRLVTGCSGVKRTTGQHPGGLMVVPKYTDIHKFTPLQRPADDVKSETITTHFDYHSISSRLVKLDILGHDDPTAIKMLEDLTGVDAKKIPLDEQKTISLFSSTEALGISPKAINSNVGTFGIPEFGTKFVRQMLEDTKPQTFSELVRISGFSHGTDVWLNNAQDLIKSGTAKLSEAISTRDDIMIYLIYKGLEPVIAFKIMEDVRKGKGLKEEYILEMKKNNVPEWYITSCNAIKYMFPKAHAVAYVTMAFRIAYFKVYHPLAFYTTFYTVRADEFDSVLISKGPNAVRQEIDKIESKGNDVTAKEKNMLTILEIALEMYERGIELMEVDIWKSDADKFQIIDGKILPPFSSIQGLGKNAAQNIITARKKKAFSSIEDLHGRTHLSKTVIELLKAEGYLNGLPDSDQLSLFS